MLSSSGWQSGKGRIFRDVRGGSGPASVPSLEKSSWVPRVPSSGPARFQRRPPCVASWGDATTLIFTGDPLARQEQDFNEETNRQSATLFIKDSHGVSIDLTEIECAQVLQYLLSLYERHGRLESLGRVGEKGPILLKLLGRHPKGELQDVEVNSLLQGQSIRIENCTDVTITVRQVEVEKVVEIGLELVRLMGRRPGGDSSAGEWTTWLS